MLSYPHTGIGHFSPSVLIQHLDLLRHRKAPDDLVIGLTALASATRNVCRWL